MLNSPAHTTALGLVLACGFAPAIAQPRARTVEPIREFVRSFPAQDPSVFVQVELIAALPYDGTSTLSNRGQDFESVFDDYDIFIIEDIVLSDDVAPSVFRTSARGTGDPRRAEDFVVHIFENNGTGLPGQDGYTGTLIMTSVPGAGFFDIGTLEFVTDFGGQCLAAGSYFLVWAVRMDFICCGSAYFFQQDGDPIVGGGEANNAWHWAPLNGYGKGTHFPVQSAPGTQAGINYLLFGEPSNCGSDCSNPDCPADLDFDGDADSDDFFLYLDRFASGDPCADIDGDSDADSDDFFAYLDQFAGGC